MRNQPSPEPDIATDSVGYTFATEKAPYLAHLARLEDEWWEVGPIKLALRERVKQIRAHNAMNEFMSTSMVASVNILDIVANDDSENDVVRWAGLSLHDISNGTRSQLAGRVEAVNSFLTKLHTTQEQVHTRIILLELPSSEVCEGRTGTLQQTSDLAPMELLLSHVLGTELEMHPLDVALFCQYKNLQDFHRACFFASRTTVKPSQASFGSLNAGLGDCVVSWLGRRPAGQSSPFTGKF